MTPGFVEVSAVYGDQISSFVDGSTLNDRLAEYVDWNSMEDYPTYGDLTAYATTDSLTAFYEKSETSSATQITNGLKGKVNNISGVANVRKISQADYDVLSAGGTADANTLYVIV